MVNTVATNVADILKHLTVGEAQAFVNASNKIAQANRYKMDEIIVVAPTAKVFEDEDGVTNAYYFQGINDSLELTARVLTNFADNVTFMRRGTAEEDPSFKQLIPYTLVTKYNEKAEPSVFVYERLSAGGEARLHGKLSVGVGGHMNQIFDAFSVDGTICEEARRELFEELNFVAEGGEEQLYDGCVLSLMGLINDDNDPVGKVHLGVLTELVIVDESINVSVSETDQLRGGWMTLEELLEPANFERLESWSKLAMMLLVKRS